MLPRATFMSSAMAVFMLALQCTNGAQSKDVTKTLADLNELYKNKAKGLIFRGMEYDAPAEISIKAEPLHQWGEAEALARWLKYEICSDFGENCMYTDMEKKHALPAWWNNLETWNDFPKECAQATDCPYVKWPTTTDGACPTATDSSYENSPKSSEDGGQPRVDPMHKCRTLYKTGATTFVRSDFTRKRLYGVTKQTGDSSGVFLLMPFNASKAKCLFPQDAWGNGCPGVPHAFTSYNSYPIKKNNTVITNKGEKLCKNNLLPADTPSGCSDDGHAHWEWFGASHDKGYPNGWCTDQTQYTSGDPEKWGAEFYQTKDCNSSSKDATLKDPLSCKKYNGTKPGVCAYRIQDKNISAGIVDGIEYLRRAYDGIEDDDTMDGNQVAYDYDGTDHIAVAYLNRSDSCFCANYEENKDKDNYAGCGRCSNVPTDPLFACRRAKALTQWIKSEGKKGRFEGKTVSYTLVQIQIDVGKNTLSFAPPIDDCDILLDTETTTVGSTKATYSLVGFSCFFGLICLVVIGLYARYRYSKNYEGEMKRYEKLEAACKAPIENSSQKAEVALHEIKKEKATAAAVEDVKSATIASLKDGINKKTNKLGCKLGWKKNTYLRELLFFVGMLSALLAASFLWCEFLIEHHDRLQMKLCCAEMSSAGCPYLDTSQCGCQHNSDPELSTAVTMSKFTDGNLIGNLHPATYPNGAYTQCHFQGNTSEGYPGYPVGQSNTSVNFQCTLLPECFELGGDWSKCFPEDQDALRTCEAKALRNGFPYMGSQNPWFTGGNQNEQCFSGGFSQNATVRHVVSMGVAMVLLFILRCAGKRWISSFSVGIDEERVDGVEWQCSTVPDGENLVNPDFCGLNAKQQEEHIREKKRIINHGYLPDVRQWDERLKEWSAAKDLENTQRQGAKHARAMGMHVLYWSITVGLLLALLKVFPNTSRMISPEDADKTLFGEKTCWGHQVWSGLPCINLNQDGGILNLVVFWAIFWVFVMECLLFFPASLVVKFSKQPNGGASTQHALNRVRGRRNQPKELEQGLMDGAGETAASIARHANKNVALLLACHWTCLTEHETETFKQVIARALDHFYPQNIFICDNGPSRSPVDHTKFVAEQACRDAALKDSELKNMLQQGDQVHYVYLPEGNKTVALYWVAEFYIKALLRNSDIDYVVISDNDVKLPIDFQIDHELLNDHPEYKAIAFTLAAVDLTNPEACKNDLSTMQDLEYRMSGFHKLAQANCGSALQPHGAISLWRYEVFCDLLLGHDTVFHGEDLQMGLLLQNQDDALLKVSTHCVVQTDAPDDFKTLFRQRVTSWDLCAHRGVFDLMCVMFTACKASSCCSKLYILLEVMTAFTDWVRPFLIVQLLFSDPFLAVTLTVAFWLLHYFELFVFTFWVLRERKDLRSPCRALMLFPVMHTVLTLMFRQYALIENVIEYSALTRKLPTVEERANGVLLPGHSEESSLLPPCPLDDLIDDIRPTRGGEQPSEPAKKEAARRAKAINWWTIWWDSSNPEYVNTEGIEFGQAI